MCSSLARLSAVLRESASRMDPSLLSILKSFFLMSSCERHFLNIVSKIKSLLQAFLWSRYFGFKPNRYSCFMTRRVNCNILFFFFFQPYRFCGCPSSNILPRISGQLSNLVKVCNVVVTVRLKAIGQLQNLYLPLVIKSVSYRVDNGKPITLVSLGHKLLKYRDNEQET